MAIDQTFVDWLKRRGGYHPRSPEHSDFLSECIIKDLVERCPAMRARAATGELVAKLKHHQQVNFSDWVIDVAFGTCVGKPIPPEPGLLIRFTAPAIIQVAIELKGIITEHKKARRNRLRDFNAFHAYAHEYDPNTIAGAFLMVNSASCFYSPLNEGKKTRSEITAHGTRRDSPYEIAKDAVDLFRSIHLRHNATDPQPGLEAIGVVVIEHDNIVMCQNPTKYAHLHKPTRVAPIPPNLTAGDPLHYETMIQRICMAYTQRFK